MEKNAIKNMVVQKYASIAKNQNSCCSSDIPCCGEGNAENISASIGYSDEDLSTVPKESNLGLGCGNPLAFASLKEGETVIDLGSGAGIDCFLASKKVGPGGRVIGIDMTPEMIEKARKNAHTYNYNNIEFRLGEIENLPAENSSADAVISNCVVNLSPDKEQVFREVFRVLKPGGRLMVSDIVLLKELPDSVKNSVAAYTGCIAGAMVKEDYIKAVSSAGFQDIKILDETAFYNNYADDDSLIKDLNDKFNISVAALKDAAKTVRSIKIRGIKP